MRTWMILITAPDGTQTRRLGLFSDGFAAIIDALQTCPEARRISARVQP